MAKVLIVEDNESIGQMVSGWLTSQSHVTDLATTGEDALLLLSQYPYDLIILDINLPGKDGLCVCKEFRDSGGNTPILMLTGKDTVKEKEEGLDTGADDYLTKPFDTRELGARIRALLRRTGSYSQDCVTLGSLSIDTKARSVKVNKTKIELAPKEFALLEFFAKNPNQVFSSDAILDRVWKSESDSTVDSVRVYINRLRSKLGSREDGPSITTVFGVGYKMTWNEDS
ncbi:MAG: response regulator transcription factor [Candidatus Obscuribacterales bacterium]|nr:response regulator transcription factor [Candidatus Obscuribacterales bacterium]